MQILSLKRSSFNIIINNWEDDSFMPKPTHTISPIITFNINATDQVVILSATHSATDHSLPSHPVKRWLFSTLLLLRMADSIIFHHFISPQSSCHLLETGHRSNRTFPTGKKITTQINPSIHEIKGRYWWKKRLSSGYFTSIPTPLPPSRYVHQHLWPMIHLKAEEWEPPTRTNLEIPR